MHTKSFGCASCLFDANVSLSVPFCLETREFQSGITMLASHRFALKYQLVPSLSEPGFKKKTLVIKNMGNLHRQ